MPSTSGRGEIFGKSSWRDTSRKSAQLWNSQSHECGTTFPSNREIAATLLQPCVQNAPRQIDEVLLATPTGKWPRGRPRTRWNDYISDLAWSRLGGASRIIWNCCWSWGITSPLWAAAPRPSLKEKKTWKWWKIYWNRFCEAVMDTWFIFQVHIIHMNEIKSKLRWKQLSV